MRGLEEEGNPKHRARVEHNKHTLLVHISDEDGRGWTTLAIDRATREWSIAQRSRQQQATEAAYELLYVDGDKAQQAVAADRAKFARLLEALRDDDRPGFALAELNDLLSGLTSGELCDAVEHADLTGLTPYLRNYVAAMVELAAHRRDVPPPAWVRDVEPMEMEPRFATPLADLRLHLLRTAPVPFKRRNIFIDSSLGDRV